jgi:hypothetical protein
MTIALRQPLADRHLADVQATPEADAHDLAYEGFEAATWSFQRMITVAGAISAVLWLGLGAVVWKALTL